MVIKKTNNHDFKELGQFTKESSDVLLTDLSNNQGENLISEIVRFGYMGLCDEGWGYRQINTYT